MWVALVIAGLALPLIAAACWLIANVDDQGNWVPKSKQGGQASVVGAFALVPPRPASAAPSSPGSPRLDLIPGIRWAERPLPLPASVYATASGRKGPLEALPLAYRRPEGTRNQHPRGQDDNKHERQPPHEAI